MKWIGNIFLLTLIWILCGARSCSNDRNIKEQQEMELLSASKDSIKQAFEVDLPVEQHLNAFELKAIQKLSDFADYMKISSDYSLDISFRKQASVMVKELFIPGEIDTRNLSMAFQEPELNTLDKLLTKSLKQGISLWIQPDHITILRSLKQENDSTFKGRLSFKYKCIPFDKPVPTGNVTGKLEIDFYALKKAKSFGKDQLRVWEVYLGDMN